MATNGVNSFSSHVIVTEKGAYKKPTILRTAGGITAGTLLAGTVAGSLLKVSQIFARKAPQEMNYIYSPRITIDGVKYSPIAKEITNGVDIAFEKSGLAHKGVKLVDLSVLRDLNLEHELPNWLNKFPKLKEQIIKNSDLFTSMAYNGNNAFCGSKTGNIYVNKEIMSYAAFHEMGHSLNKLSTIGKFLLKLRGPGVALAGIAFLIGLLKRKKADGEKPNGIVDKVTTFIKNNSAAVAFTGMLPTVLEEGLASKKGADLMKNVLSENTAKIVKNYNKKAWLAYAGFAAAITAATWIATKVRDVIAGPQKVV